MDVDKQVVEIAAAIGEPARAKMLFFLLDSRARTSTELAIAAEISPSTATIHLKKLHALGLIKQDVQGRHRYYMLAGTRVAAAIETLSVLATGRKARPFHPSTPARLRGARSCYDHLAGHLGVSLHDRLKVLGWIRIKRGSKHYEISAEGLEGFTKLGLDMAAVVKARRQTAIACMDWSERRPHLGGALGAALLAFLLQHRWVLRDADSRVLSLTYGGMREFKSKLGMELY
jgi:DNA-binding transcriptional ArsR family regulator